MSKLINIEGMSCGHCEKRVKNALEEIGVEVVRVSAEENLVEVNENGLSYEKIKEAIEDVGYDIID